MDFNVSSPRSEGVRSKSIINLFAAMVLSPFALSGCTSGVAQDTYVVQFTTDMSPHVVQLNREVWKDGSRTFQPVLSLDFPRASYIYRDNQEGYRQTVVGLSLSKRTLGPLSLDLAREVGGTDQTQLLRAHQRNTANEVFVTLAAGSGAFRHARRTRPTGGLGAGQVSTSTSPEFRAPPSRGVRILQCASSAKRSKGSPRLASL